MAPLQSAEYREAAIRGQVGQRRLHDAANMRVDFGDVGVFAELGRDVDRLQHLRDDLRGSGKLIAPTLSPNGMPIVTATCSDRVRRFSPSRFASHSPRVRYNWVSCPPIDTAGTIGTPASMAVVT